MKEKLEIEKFEHQHMAQGEQHERFGHLKAGAEHHGKFHHLEIKKVD
jgi:hypothetical protein